MELSNIHHLGENLEIIEGVRKHHLNYQVRAYWSQEKINNYNDKVKFVITLLDQYWQLMAKPIDERNLIISQLPVYYALNLYTIDNRLKISLDVFNPLLEPIFRQHIFNRHH